MLRNEDLRREAQLQPPSIARPPRRRRRLLYLAGAGLLLYAGVKLKRLYLDPFRDVQLHVLKELDALQAPSMDDLADPTHAHIDVVETAGPGVGASGSLTKTFDVIHDGRVMHVCLMCPASGPHAPPCVAVDDGGSGTGDFLGAKPAVVINAGSIAAARPLALALRRVDPDLTVVSFTHAGLLNQHRLAADAAAAAAAAGTPVRVLPADGGRGGLITAADVISALDEAGMPVTPLREPFGAQLQQQQQSQLRRQPPVCAPAVSLSRLESTSVQHAAAARGANTLWGSFARVTDVPSQPEVSTAGKARDSSGGGPPQRRPAADPLTPLVAAPAAADAAVPGGDDNTLFSSYFLPPAVPAEAPATPDWESGALTAVLRAVGAASAVLVSSGDNWLATSKAALRNPGRCAGLLLLDPALPSFTPTLGVHSVPHKATAAPSPASLLEAATEATAAAGARSVSGGFGGSASSGGDGGVTHQPPRVQQRLGDGECTAEESKGHRGEGGSDESLLLPALAEAAAGLQPQLQLLLSGPPRLPLPPQLHLHLLAAGEGEPGPAAEDSAASSGGSSSKSSRGVYSTRSGRRRGSLSAEDNWDGDWPAAVASGGTGGFAFAAPFLSQLPVHRAFPPAALAEVPYTQYDGDDGDEGDEGTLDMVSSLLAVRPIALHARALALMQATCSARLSGAQIAEAVSVRAYLVGSGLGPAGTVPAYELIRAGSSSWERAPGVTPAEHRGSFALTLLRAPWDAAAAAAASVSRAVRAMLGIKQPEQQQPPAPAPAAVAAVTADVPSGDAAAATAAAAAEGAPAAPISSSPTRPGQRRLLGTASWDVKDSVHRSLALDVAQAVLREHQLRTLSGAVGTAAAAQVSRQLVDAGIDVSELAAAAASVRGAVGGSGAADRVGDSDSAASVDGVTSPPLLSSVSGIVVGSLVRRHTDASLGAILAARTEHWLEDQRRMRQRQRERAGSRASRQAAAAADTAAGGGEDAQLPAPPAAGAVSPLVLVSSSHAAGEAGGAAEVARDADPGVQAQAALLALHDERVRLPLSDIGSASAAWGLLSSAALDGGGGGGGGGGGLETSFPLGASVDTRMAWVTAHGEGLKAEGFLTHLVAAVHASCDWEALRARAPWLAASPTPAAGAGEGQGAGKDRRLDAATVASLAGVVTATTAALAFPRSRFVHARPAGPAGAAAAHGSGGGGGVRGQGWGSWLGLGGGSADTPPPAPAAAGSTPTQQPLAIAPVDLFPALAAYRLSVLQTLHFMPPRQALALAHAGVEAAKLPLACMAASEAELRQAVAESRARRSSTPATQLPPRAEEEGDAGGWTPHDAAAALARPQLLNGPGTWVLPLLRLALARALAAHALGGHPLAYADAALEAGMRAVLEASDAALLAAASAGGGGGAGSTAVTIASHMPTYAARHPLLLPDGVEKEEEEKDAAAGIGDGVSAQRLCRTFQPVHSVADGLAGLAARAQSLEPFRAELEPQNWAMAPQVLTSYATLVDVSADAESAAEHCDLSLLPAAALDISPALGPLLGIGGVGIGGFGGLGGGGGGAAVGPVLRRALTGYARADRALSQRPRDAASVATAPVQPRLLGRGLGEWAAANLAGAQPSPSRQGAPFAPADSSSNSSSSSDSGVNHDMAAWLADFGGRLDVVDAHLAQREAALERAGEVHNLRPRQQPSAAAGPPPPPPRPLPFPLTVLLTVQPLVRLMDPVVSAPRLASLGTLGIDGSGNVRGDAGAFSVVLAKASPETFVLHARTSCATPAVMHVRKLLMEHQRALKAHWEAVLPRAVLAVAPETPADVESSLKQATAALKQATPAALVAGVWRWAPVPPATKPSEAIVGSAAAIGAFKVWPTSAGSGLKVVRSPAAAAATDAAPVGVLIPPSHLPVISGAANAALTIIADVAAYGGPQPYRPPTAKVVAEVLALVRWRDSGDGAARAASGSAP